MNTAADSPFRSFYWIFQSSLSFSIMGVAVKFLATDFSSPSLVFYRSIFNLICLLPLFLLPDFRLVRKGSRILVLRGCFGFLGLSLHYYALKNLPIGVAYLISFIAPIFVIIFSYFFLGERLLKSAFLFIAMAFIGFIFLSSPTFFPTDTQVHYPILPLLGAVFGSICAAAAYTTLRAAGRSFKPELIVFYFAIVSTVLSTPYFVLNMELPQTKEEIILLLVMSGTATFAQICLTKGYQFSKAGPVSVMSGMSSVFSLLWGYVVFSEVLSFAQVMGALFIFFGVSGLSLYKKH